MQEVKTAIFDPKDGKPPYRLGVLLVLLNNAGEVFAGVRTDMPSDGKPWQLPQGGIKAFHIENRLTGQESIEQAAKRELSEEVGTKVKAGIIAVGAQPIAFEFDRDHNSKYRGQMLTPVLMRFQGGTIDVSKIEEGDTKPAFSNYGWFTPAEILKNATAVKLSVYEQALAGFMPLVRGIEPVQPQTALYANGKNMPKDFNL
jgi:8-oxo-dGTP pyrophosphatase MutT (NUDIX family)